MAAAFTAGGGGFAAIGAGTLALSGAVGGGGDFGVISNPDSSIYGQRNFIIDRKGVIEYYKDGTYELKRPF